MSDRKPLLPTTHRYSQNPIRFPSSGGEGAPSSSSSGSQGDAGPRGGKGVEGRKPGLPKVSRECLWSEFKCYGKHIAPVILVNLILLAIGLSIYFTR